jgi:hypothetical protein
LWDNIYRHLNFCMKQGRSRVFEGHMEMLKMAF